MSSKVIVLAAAVTATASAFAPSTGFKPALRQSNVAMAYDRSGKAPLIQVFDHRGCTRVPKEYTGAKTNGPDDEMLVKVSSYQVPASESAAAALLQQTVGNLVGKGKK